jgi:LacI family transcriptional regulator
VIGHNGEGHEGLPDRVGRVTLRDIADSVGLSVNTVSRALAGKDSVKDSTRAMVQAEADRLGYVPNSMARSLVLGAAMTLGLVITNPSNPLYADLISAIEQRGRVHGYSLLLVATEENVEHERTAARELLRWGVDGAIVVPVQREYEHLRRLISPNMPIVLVNRDVPELGCDFVGIDNTAGVYESTRHLLAQGDRRIWLLEEDLPVSSIAERIKGFTRALATEGLSADDGNIIRVPSLRYESSALPWDPAQAYLLLRELLSRSEPPTAIMVGNDYLALGVYRAVAEAGLRIPEDVRVVGYADHPFSAYLAPPLTTVQLPTADIGEKAVDLLLDRFQRKVHDEPQKILYPPRLIERASSRTAG